MDYYREASERYTEGRRTERREERHYMELEKNTVRSSSSHARESNHNDWNRHYRDLDVNTVSRVGNEEMRWQARGEENIEMAREGGSRQRHISE